jgi:GrpB-like predicted nucleotidyltransferase (UPF0157 family)
MEEFIPVAPRVVDYEPVWPGEFAREAAGLDEALGSVPHVVQHIGSTAVPGLPAKPVIDIMVGVPDYGQFDLIRERLVPMGYVWDPHAERDEPARKVFRKGPADLGQLRSHHLHLTILNGDYWRRILAFRDELRSDPSAAAAYAQVKQELLATCHGDSRAYTAGKGEIVKRIERQAGVHLL